MKLILVPFVCAILTAGCATTLTPYETAVRSAVLSVADCRNPEILLVGDAIADVDHEAYFRELGRIAYSFERVKLGPEAVGYRADLIPCGQGWSGYRHARLFELCDAQLFLVFELEGPYLFIQDGEAVNGRYRLAHWVGDDPLTAKHQYYTFNNGHYVKNPTTEAQQPPERDK
ncbi:MAG: hypothetical protein ACOCUY_01475, partial [Verrucomicrobiota bacterium]